MSKYINADEYRKVLNGESDERTYCINENAYDDGLDRGLGIAIDILDEMPSADVVEVVRCKDCKHSKYREDYDDYECEASGCGLVNNADFYCADGERRDTK